MRMSAGTKRRCGAAEILWALLALCLPAAMPARAQTRPATNPIVTSSLQRIVDKIPVAPLDLPPYLAKPSDVYLLVTAGASYTAVQVLANPEVPPQTVAHALSSALVGTPLRGRTVEWSADRYSAAQVSEDHHRFGAMHGSNTVLIAPLMAGLRRAGLTPHLLLRVATHAGTAPLSISHYGTRAFFWYDARHLGGLGSVTVTDRMTWITPARLLAYYLVPPLVCLLGLWLAGIVSSRAGLEDAARRLVFRRVGSYAVMGGFMAQVGGMVYLLRTPTPAGVADLWFGSSTTTGLVPFLVAAVVPLMLFMVLVHKQEIRRFGPVAIGPAIPVPMSDEEKAVRKRVAQYSRVPHIIGSVVLAVALFAVPRSSPLYPVVHPVAIFLPLIGGSLVPLLFKKRLDRFTQKALDDDLTWRARQLGQTLGVRMPDVFVEDSSRAAHLASASHQGHHITLSRKLQATFTAAETNFVLAHHLARMKGRGGSNMWWMRSLFLLPMLLLSVLVFLPRLVPGSPTVTPLMVSPWFPQAMFAGILLWGVSVLMVVKSSAGRQAKQDTAADRDALEATGNLAAAEGALDKLSADAALTPEAQAAAQFSGGFGGKAGNNMVQLASGRLLLRRAVLQKTAATLRFAPAPGAESAAPDLSPFSSRTDSR